MGNATILGDVRTGYSAGTMSVVGDLGLGLGSDWFVEIGGANPIDFDRLLVSGVLSAGGNINISLINGYTPASGTSYQIASFASFVNNGYTFDFSGANLAPGQSWDTSNFGTNGTIAIVPEPSVICLAALLTTGLLVRRRR